MSGHYEKIKLKNKANKTKDPTDIRNHKKTTELCCEPKQRGKA